MLLKNQIKQRKRFSIYDESLRAVQDPNSCSGNFTWDFTPLYACKNPEIPLFYEPKKVFSLDF